jgi:hypothetical protein
VKRIWRRIEKIFSILAGRQRINNLSPLNIFFHKQIKNHYETMLLIAAKYAISLLTRSVINRPKNPRVIDSFLRSQILQITKAHLSLIKDVTLWLKIDGVVHYVLQFPDNF